jgi:hypothetical protein
MSTNFFRQCWKQNKRWIWGDVVVPLIITRLALLLVGWFSQYFLPDPKYPAQEALKRGWHFSSHRLLDIWGRWDSGWYSSIVSDGYTLRGDIDTVQSNIAFFPLYPYIVKFLFQILPDQLHTLETILLLGVIVSNIFFLGALIVFYKLVISIVKHQRIAKRAVLYLLLFPTSFFFSCFYTEATYLFFSIATFYAAAKQRWAIASILGYFVALSRPLGVLILIPLILDYLKNKNWKIHKIKGDVAYLLFIPAGFFTFLLSLYQLTGNLFAPMQIQSAWNKIFAMPWETLIKPVFYVPFITEFDQLFTVGFILLGIVALIRLPSPSYGIYSLLIVAPPLMTGNLRSAVRYCAVVFPIFIVLALFGKKYSIHQFITILFLTLQILFMVAWSNFYWIG